MQKIKLYITILFFLIFSVPGISKVDDCLLNAGIYQNSGSINKKQDIKSQKSRTKQDSTTVKRIKDPNKSALHTKGASPIEVQRPSGSSKPEGAGKKSGATKPEKK